jgi:hypothetical protein
MMTFLRNPFQRMLIVAECTEDSGVEVFGRLRRTDFTAGLEALTGRHDGDRPGEQPGLER